MDGDGDRSAGPAPGEYCSFPRVSGEQSDDERSTPESAKAQVAKPAPAEVRLGGDDRNRARIFLRCP